METYKDYIKRKEAETQEQLKRQSAINADAAANAMASAAIAATNTHAEATSGGMIDSNAQPETVTAARDMQAQQETAQPGTEGPVDQEPEKKDLAPQEPLPMPHVDNPSKDGAMEPLPGTVAENPSSEGMLNNYGNDNARMIAIAKDVIGQDAETNLPAERKPDTDNSKPWYENAYPGYKIISDNGRQIILESPDGRRIMVGKDQPVTYAVNLEPAPGSKAANTPIGDLEKKLSDGEGEGNATNQPNAAADTSEEGSYEGQVKLFSDRINEYLKYKQQQEDEMKAQEKANTISTMATGATEVAAGIINMLSVGEGHASNQVYRNYSQDWMRKAERDLREHRNRRENLQATMNRLKEQQQQVQNAVRLEDIREKQRQAQEEIKAAEEENNRKMREQKIQDDRNADMLLRGFVPDESAPGGYRFDPNLAAQIAGAKKGSAASGSKVKTETKQDAEPAKTDSASSAGKTDYAAKMAGSMANGWSPKQPGVGVLAPEGQQPAKQTSKEDKWSGYKVS